MTVQLFREEVIEAGRERLAGTVIAATPPRARLYVMLLALAAAAIAALLIFGQYASRAQVKGVLAYDSGIARVYPGTAADIRTIHVHEGQFVPAGAPLVTLSLAQGQGGVAPQLGQLAAQDNELGRQQQLALQLGSTETGALARQKAGLAEGIASLDRQRSLAAGQARLAESATRRAQRLAAEGAGTQRQVEDSRSALLARRAEIEALNERLVAQRETLRAIDSQIAQRGIEAQRSAAEIGAQRAALAEQRAGLSRLDQIILTAPVGGEISAVSAEIGQRARPDSSLVTIVPRGSRLQVWLYAPSRAIGFVRPGQEVRLHFDAFPYQKYGAGRGTVTAISRVPIEPSALDSALGIQEPVFRIRVAIDQAVPKLGDAAAARLRPGMTLSANLVLERRSLWEVLFKPVASAIGQ